jgi:REP element-mobilizing transposase RayT
MKDQEEKDGCRRSIRLADYDYSQAGYYFVTVCTQAGLAVFGNIAEGKMALNDTGRMIAVTWQKIPEYYNGINVDTFQIMPNHIHGIIIVGADSRFPVGAVSRFPVGAGPRACPREVHPQGVAPTRLSLGDVVGRFKSLTTRKYVDGVNLNKWPSFDTHLWQRNYYEHVIRSENDLSGIREYIVNNPAKWQEDEYYVKQKK